MPGSRRGMALSVVRPAKRRRLVGKQSLQTTLVKEVLGEENSDASREVYLVTLPNTHKEGLKTPAAYTREEVRDAVLDCCRSPEGDPAWLASHPGQAASPVGAKKLVVFKEYHAPVEGVAQVHYHVACTWRRRASSALSRGPC